MDNKQNESDNLHKTKSFIKSQAILKKAINNINLEKEQYNQIINNGVVVKSASSLSKRKNKNFYRKYKS